MSGIAQGGIAVRSGGNLAVQGKRISGLATNGLVVWRGVPPEPFVTAFTVSGLRADFTGRVGFWFTVGSQPITIFSLGRWVFAGEAAPSTTIVLTDTANTVLRSTIFANSTPGEFNYGRLSPSFAALP